MIRGDNNGVGMLTTQNYENLGAIPTKRVLELFDAPAKLAP